MQGRMLTKDRMIRLHTNVTDTTCCLCENHAQEIARHLFAECSWIKEVRQQLMPWLGIAIQPGKIKQMLEWINRRHWPRLKKEMVTTVCSAIMYHAWRTKNSKICKGINIHTEIVVTQIKRETIERIEIVQLSKKAGRCQSMIQKLICN